MCGGSCEEDGKEVVMLVRCLCLRKRSILDHVSRKFCGLRILWKCVLFVYFHNEALLCLIPFGWKDCSGKVLRVVGQESNFPNGFWVFKFCLLCDFLFFLGICLHNSTWLCSNCSWWVWRGVHFQWRSHLALFERERRKRAGKKPRC